MEQMIGTMIGNYRLNRLLGDGGMGSVFEATDITLQRHVALKMMHPHLAARENFQQRFLQEARAIAQLEHPNIVKIYQASFQDRQLFLVMELVTGGSLRAYLHHLEKQDKVIQLSEALELVRQMAVGLHYAHDQQMVHRDIKPDNVLLRPATMPGQHSTFNILLADFGLAQLATGIIDSIPGVAKGTLPYMSPEQCLGQKVDQRTDIYALGVVLYELVVGKRPFDPRTLPEAIQMHTRERLPRIESQGRANIPVRVQQVIEKCLAKEPNDRFQTAYDVNRELGLALNGMAQAEPVPAPERLDSLVTYLMSQPLPAEAPPHTAVPVSQPGKDRLVVINDTEPTRTLTLEGAVTRIGRDSDNDLVLKSQKIGVSRHHTRIERGVDGLYRVTDLESTNGTFMGEEKLETKRPYIWRPGATVRIGDYWLQIEPGISDDDTGLHQGTIPQYPDSAIPAIPTPVAPSSPVIIKMTPEQLTVEAGQVVNGQIELLNPGGRVDHYRVEILGLPSEWFTLLPPDVPVMPGQRAIINLRLSPPRTSTSRAGKHIFRVRVHSTTRPEHPTELKGELVIGAFYQFTAEHQPRRLHGRGKVTVKIENKGNAPEHYALEMRDNEAALTIPQQMPQVTVEPGAAGETQIPLAAKKRAFIGSSQIVGYELDVIGQGGEQTLRGDVNIKPRISSSLAALAATLAAAACFLIVLGVNAFLTNQNNQNATATAVAIAQALATDNSATAQALAVVQTATAEALAAAGTATAAAGTATAEFNAADPDGDGLTNAAELENETDPNNPDTDGDNLLDGEEIRQYRTNPLNADTDNDGANDGKEINDRTDPNNRDSDQDGVSDGRDACHDMPNLGSGFNDRGCPIPIVPTVNPDTDGDGFSGAADQCPNDSGPASSNGCPDTDLDGIPDNRDNCPHQGSTGNGIDSQGCPNPAPDQDPDGDGVSGSADECPNDAGTAHGCPDSDHDGVPDHRDHCPHEGSTGSGVNSQGCPISGDAGTPADFIHAYYAAIVERNYDFTWTHLTTDFKNRWNCPREYNNDPNVDDYICNLPAGEDYDFDAYIDWWNSVERVDVLRADEICNNGEIAVVITSFRYALFNGDIIDEEQRYTKLRLVDGEWRYHDAGRNPRTCVLRQDG